MVREDRRHFRHERINEQLFREDLVALKRDVASLIDHMKGGATNIVQDAAGSSGARRPLGQGSQLLC